MRRMYVPSGWLAEFMEDRDSKYYRYTRFPLTDDDIGSNDIKACLRQYSSLDDLRGIYAYYRDVLAAHASCVFPALAADAMSSRERLAREILKMEPGVKMLRYRSFLITHPKHLDTRMVFDLFLERHDSVCLDHIGFEPTDVEETGLSHPDYAGIVTARMNRINS